MKFVVGIVLFEDAEELDWAGPFEVFQMAAMGEELQVVLLAEREGPIRCAKGLRVLPETTFDAAPFAQRVSLHPDLDVVHWQTREIRPLLKGSVADDRPFVKIALEFVCLTLGPAAHSPSATGYRRTV